MPGTKIELKTGDDPNPAPYLFVSDEILLRLSPRGEVLRGSHRGDHWHQGLGHGRQGILGGQNRHLQAGPRDPGQPSHVRQLRGHVQLDLP